MPTTAPVGLVRALDALADENWNTAKKEVSTSGPIARDIVLWHVLRASEGTFDEARAFVARRGDWPGMAHLRKQVEATIPADAHAQTVLDWFAGHPPATLVGALRLAGAYRSLGQDAAAAEVLLNAYAGAPSDSSDTLKEVLSYLPQLTASDHAIRARNFLDLGNPTEAQRLLDRLSPDQRKLAQARIAVQNNTRGVNAIINAVPAQLRSDKGLAGDRFVWRAKRGNFDDAIAMALATPHMASRGGERLGSLLRSYARRLMAQGRNVDAYRLASEHGMTGGRHFADLEWLAGFIALRKLDDPVVALAHFRRHGAAVATPISVARSAYWQGRALEAMGDIDGARRAYGVGAQHQTAFYGLLSAEKISARYDPALAGRQMPAAWRGAQFTQSSVFEAGMMLLATEEQRMGVRFLTHLVESLPLGEITKMAAMAEELGHHYLQVQIAKRAVTMGHTLERPLFPLHREITSQALPVKMELALAIARRESEFLPTAISGAGARGLMQLMPATAEEVSRDLGLRYHRSRLTRDPDYNVVLGSHYLSQLHDDFGDSPVQVAAGYNAGPSRSWTWMREFGDPRKGEVDIIDWIEHIPFRETRNYVMRVTESLPVYRARLAGSVPAGPVQFTPELLGSVPPRVPVTRPSS